VQPLLHWKNNKYYTFQVCVCGLSYPARKAHASYYTVICGLSGSAITFRNFANEPKFIKISTSWSLDNYDRRKG